MSFSCIELAAALLVVVATLDNTTQRRAETSDLDRRKFFSFFSCVVIKPEGSPWASVYSSVAGGGCFGKPGYIIAYFIVHMDLLTSKEYRIKKKRLVLHSI